MKDIITFDVNFILTTHAKDVIKQRFSHNVENYEHILKHSKIATYHILQAIKKECPNHDRLVHPNSEIVYWFNKSKSEQLWRVTVTHPKKPTEYIVITYFEVDYTKYT